VLARYTAPDTVPSLPYIHIFPISFTYDHRFKKIALPVRSAVLKLVTGGLVVRWVTTGESPLLYVFAYVSSLSFCQVVIVAADRKTSEAPLNRVLLF
jgi:hypothetical protein